MSNQDADGRENIFEIFQIACFLHFSERMKKKLSYQESLLDGFRIILQYMLLLLCNLPISKVVGGLFIVASRLCSVLRWTL